MTVPKNMDEQQDLSSKSSIEQMLRAAGQMGSLILQMDWSKTVLGPIEAWPQSLKTAVSICLFSEFPIHIWWGPEFIELYNDAYRPILGETKHPASLGQPGIVTSTEIWPIIGPMLRHVYENAVSTRSDRLMLPMERYGFIEETYFTLSYSPIFVETGGVGGIFTVVSEITRQVLVERRLRTLYRLSEHIGTARNVEETCNRAAEILADNREDIPFALIYMMDESANQARLAASSGFEKSSEANPLSIALNDRTSSLWRLTEVQDKRQSIRIGNLSEHFETALPSPWEETPHTALLLPIFSAAETKVIGFLIAGISARLALDEAYQHFYELVAGHLSAAIANARAHEEERKRAEALAELDRARTEFFSNISHEFRTPLTLILNPLQEVLRDSSNLSSEQKENLEAAHRNSIRLLKLVNTLLDFSRIQANRIHASFEATDLASLSIDLASNFRSLIERAGLRFVIDCPPLPDAVYVDREMWEKVMLNLLSNAFKFTFEGEITVSLQAVDKHVELKVQDTGIGINESDLKHIFERFHRVNGAQSRTHEGSGIGLALVAELVRFHGGEISVTSQPAQGTSFLITIPFGSKHLPQEQIRAARTLSSTAPGAAAYTEEALRWLTENEQEKNEANPQGAASKFDTNTSVALEAGQFSNAKILIADDNADMRDYLQRLLGKYYQIEVAHDGMAALRLIQQQSPDLVIADIMMPNLDGIAFLKEIRSHSKSRALPVLLLSARAGEEARIEGLQAGADDYLSKPFSARELLARVEAQLQLSQLRQETQATIDNIVESIADPFYVLDHGWHFLYVNQAAQQMLGKTREELIGKHISEVFLQGLGNRVYEIMQSAVVSQRPAAFEAFSSFLNRWFDINIYPGSRGIAIYFKESTNRTREK